MYNKHFGGSLFFLTTLAKKSIASLISSAVNKPF
jgi:hypothetical protein